jgi:hypothetical protein
MSVQEDIQNKQNQATQAQTAAENKKITDAIRKRNADLEKRQKEAKRVIGSKKSIYDLYIQQLSTGVAAVGKNKGKKLSPVKLQQIRDAAESLDKEINELNRIIAQKPEVIKLPPAPKPQATKPIAGPTGSVTLQATKTAEETAAKETAANKKTTDTKGKIPAKGTMPEVPIGKPSGKPISGSFDPALARAGEEASMGATPSIPTKSERDLTSILQKTEFWYDLPDYIFKTVPDLGKLLVQAVNEEWDEEKFLSKARLTTWWQQNSAPIRTRIIARAKFNELTAGGQDASKTEYALDSAAIKRNVQTRARQMGANLDENAVNQIVSRIYDGFLENDTVAIDSFIAPYIGKVTSIVGTGLGIQPTGYTGQALQNYQALQAVAKANGLSITDILPKFSLLPGQKIDDLVLQKLATGELDINRLAQDARMIAAQGTPDYVKGLLQQGYDLEQIYAPYKNVMAQILELNPDEIKLNDDTLRAAIGQDKEMNIFDFKKALRKDSRWQYTENAREEVANSVLGVLRDFGFQG